MVFNKRYALIFDIGKNSLRFKCKQKKIDLKRLFACYNIIEVILFIFINICDFNDMAYSRDVDITETLFDELGFDIFT